MMRAQILSENVPSMTMTKQNTLFYLFLSTAIAIIAVIYAALPHGINYFTLRSQEERYIPLTLYNFDIMNVHGARYREMVDGNIFASDVDTYEHQNGPSVWPLLSAALLAPFFVTFATIFPGIIITDFLFPILTFFSFFFVIRAFTKQKFFALFSALFLVLYGTLLQYIPPLNLVELKVLILRLFPFLVEKVPISPKYSLREAFIPGAPFFILFFYFTLQATIAESKRKFFTVLAGIFYGLLFYLYFFFWVFATVFLGLFFLALLLAGKKNAAITVFAAGTIGALVSIPFWVSHLNLAQLPLYDELIERNAGKEIGRAFRLWLWKEYLAFAATVAFALFFGRKLKLMTQSLFLAALALSGVVVLNVQVVTGFNVQSDHWFSRVFIITQGITYAVFSYYLFLYCKPRCEGFIAKHKKKLLALCAAAFLYFVVSIAYNQAVTIPKYVRCYTVPAAILESYEWLNANTKTDSVVITPSLETNIELPVYTHNRIFLARAHTSLASEKEIMERLYSAYHLFKISPAYIYEIPETELGRMYFFAALYNDKSLDAYLVGKPKEPFPTEVRERMLNEYIFFGQQESLSYRADYIYIGPRERALGIDEEILLPYKKVYDKNGVAIYTWKK